MLCAMFFFYIYQTENKQWPLFSSQLYAFDLYFLLWLRDPVKVELKNNIDNNVTNLFKGWIFDLTDYFITYL